MSKHAGVYTGKFSVGQRVHSGNTYPTGRYYGTVRNVFGGQEHNYPYGVQWDGETLDDGTELCDDCWAKKQEATP